MNNLFTVYTPYLFISLRIDILQFVNRSLPVVTQQKETQAYSVNSGNVPAPGIMRA